MGSPSIQSQQPPDPNAVSGTANAGKPSDTGTSSSNIVTMLTGGLENLLGKKEVKAEDVAGISSAAVAAGSVNLNVKTKGSESGSDLTISNPSLAPSDDELVELQIKTMGSGAMQQQNGSTGSSPFGSNVAKGISDYVNAKTSDAKSSATAAIKAVTSSLKAASAPNALLGGLFAVALDISIEKGAHMKSLLDKSMSNLWVTMEKMSESIASTMSSLTKQEASVEALGHLFSAVMSAMAIGTTAFGVGKAMRTLKVGGPGAEQAAQITMQKFTALSQVSSGLGTNLGEAVVAKEKGDIEATKIILQQIQEQVKSMIDKITQAGSDAHSSVMSMLKLLMDIESAATQAFRSLTGK